MSYYRCSIHYKVAVWSNSNYPPCTISCTENCIIHQSCNCEYSSNGIVIPPSLLQCHNNTNSLMDFPTNLAILQELWIDREHQTINDDSLFQEKLDVTIPTINIFNHSFHSKLTADQQHHHKLRQLLANAKRGVTSYATLSEAIFILCQTITGSLIILHSFHFGDILIMYCHGQANVWSYSWFKMS